MFGGRGNLAALPNGLNSFVPFLVYQRLLASASSRTEQVRHTGTVGGAFNAPRKTTTPARDHASHRLRSWMIPDKTVGARFIHF